MSIRIVPAPGSGDAAEQVAPAVRWPTPQPAYTHRAARLRTLAPQHAMADYLLWCAALTDVQQATAEALPLPPDEKQRLALALEERDGMAPLHSGRWHRCAHWQAVLEHMLAHLQPHAQMQGDAVQRALAALSQADPALREQWADALLADLRGDPLPPGSTPPEAGAAQLLWAALSLYWRQLAACLTAAQGAAELGEHRHLCPVCGHAPTGSLVLSGAQAGLRYLQCSLCESQWHVVRTTCSNCNATGALDYWSLEDEKAAIKAENCGDCHSYLKAFYLPTNPQLELVADDLASLALDAEMEHMGMARSGLNPLLLP